MCWRSRLTPRRKTARISALTLICCLKTNAAPSRNRWFIPVLVTLGCLAFYASAHDGPEHEIEELTERIAKVGESADLLIQRAIEYGVLGKAAEAAKDLERALYYEAHSVTARRELSRAYFAMGKTNE